MSSFLITFPYSKSRFLRHHYNVSSSAQVHFFYLRCKTQYSYMLTMEDHEGIRITFRFRPPSAGSLNYLAPLLSSRPRLLTNYGSFYKLLAIRGYLFCRLRPRLYVDRIRLVAFTINKSILKRIVHSSSPIKTRHKDISPGLFGSQNLCNVIHMAFQVPKKGLIFAVLGARHNF